MSMKLTKNIIQLSPEDLKYDLYPLIIFKHMKENDSSFDSQPIKCIECNLIVLGNENISLYFNL